MFTVLLVYSFFTLICSRSLTDGPCISYNIEVYLDLIKITVYLSRLFSNRVCRLRHLQDVAHNTITAHQVASACSKGVPPMFQLRRKFEKMYSNEKLKGHPRRVTTFHEPRVVSFSCIGHCKLNDQATFQFLRFLL